MNARAAVLEGLALVAIALLPVVADALREQTERCSQDGVVVDPSYAVVIDFGGDEQYPFCGVACADRWLTRGGRTALSVLVTDVRSTRPIDARTAFYVKTYAGSREGVPDPIRVFASRDDALAHIREHGGELLVGPRRPLQQPVSSPLLETKDGR